MNKYSKENKDAIKAIAGFVILIVIMFMLIFSFGCSTPIMEKSVEQLYWESGRESLLLGLDENQKEFMRETRRMLLE